MESRFAWRTRLLDCVWAGLPVISTAGDPLSDLIAEKGLGQSVAPRDAKLLAQTILDMLDDDTLRDRVRERAAVVQRKLTWPKIIEPIAAFLEYVSFAPDAVDAARIAANARQIIEQKQIIEGLREHIEAIKQGRVMRLMGWLNKILGRE